MARSEVFSTSHVARRTSHSRRRKRMKGLITKAALLCTAAGTVGCYGYRDIVDPCYPERYEYAARQNVRAALTPQVLNGHVLDQTVWNYHFDPDEKGQPTARLNAAGLAHLARLARTR